MTNNDEWYWEEGDSFTIKSSNTGPYTVTEVHPTFLCFTTKDGKASSVIKSNTEPYIPEKLRKFITRVEPWAPDPEDELIKKIRVLYLEAVRVVYHKASDDALGNELVTTEEREATCEVIDFIAEGKSRDPQKLAREIRRIHQLTFKRY